MSDIPTSNIPLKAMLNTLVNVGEGVENPRDFIVDWGEAYAREVMDDLHADIKKVVKTGMFDDEDFTEGFLKGVGVWLKQYMEKMKE